MNNNDFIYLCEEKLKEKFKTVDEISYFNQVKVLNALKKTGSL